jgi:hypothetical protein
MGARLEYRLCRTRVFLSILRESLAGSPGQGGNRPFVLLGENPRRVVIDLRTAAVQCCARLNCPSRVLPIL